MEKLRVVENQEDGEMETGGQVNADALVSFVTRIERLKAEQNAITYDINSVFNEAKACGFDVKIMRELIKRRAMEPDQVEEMTTLLELYEMAMQSGKAPPPPKKLG